LRLLRNRNGSSSEIWGCDGQITQITVDLKGAPEVSAGHKVAGGTSGQVEVESRRYPYCFDSDTKSSGSTRSITVTSE
jgi:hypothetical protein